ncbi:MAG: branched-chain amino acid ABC transporter permease [Trueperaceae bacterium]|nr:branched-chain amino acid ABC transporter permease [Trueperaceae bacterium]
MTAETWVKGLLLGVPLALLLAQLLRGWGLWRLLALPAGAAAGVAITAWGPGGLTSYLVSFTLMGSIYAVLTLGLNVQWGYTGLFNIGVAAFFAMGAFTTALVTTVPPTGPMAAFSQQAFGLGAPFLVGVVAAGVTSGLLAWLVGRPTLKLRDDYLAIATIGIAEVVRLFFQNERWLANGPQPLRGIPQPLACLTGDGCAWLPSVVNDAFVALGPRDYPYVYLAVAALVLAVVYLLLERMIESPWGRVLRAVREEESSARMYGKDAASFKVQAFVVGAVVMGVGGALYAHYMASIDYSHFDPLYATFLIWVMLMLGGSGNNRGAILGAFVVWGIWSGTASLVDALRPALEFISPELPGRAPYLRFLFISVLLLAILHLRPQGMIGERRRVE